MLRGTLDRMEFEAGKVLASVMRRTMENKCLAACVNHKVFSANNAIWIHK